MKQNKQTLRAIQLGVVGAAALALLSGCGASSAAAQTKTVTFWYPQAGQFNHVMTKLIKSFEATHKGIRIQAQSVPIANMSQKIITAVAGGSPPNVAMPIPFDIPSLASKGALIPIDKLGKPGAGYYPNLLQAYSFKGVLYALPYDTGDMAIYANVPMFQAAHITRPPTTFTALLADAKRLTNPSKGEFGIVLPTKVDNITADWWFDFLHSYGGHILNASRTRAAFDSPAGLRAMKFWYQAFDVLKAAPLAPINNLTMVSDYETGKVGMLPIFPQFISTVEKLNFRTKTIPMPRGFRSHIGGFGLAIFKGAKHPHAAWTFVHWMSEPAHAVQVNMGLGTLPVRTSTLHLPVYRAYLKKQPLMGAFVQGLPTVEGVPQVSSYPAIENTVAQAVQEVIYKRETAQAALAAAAAKVNQLLK